MSMGLFVYSARDYTWLYKYNAHFVKLLFVQLINVILCISTIRKIG
jgi:hypothetical protein